MTVDVDTRMRSAGDSLVRASERLSPAAPPRSLRPIATVVAGVVAAVALAAGTVAVMATGEDDGRDTYTSTSVPRLVPDVIPDGLRPSGVTELPLDADVVPGSVPITVYGDPAADDPFADADLAIYTSGRPVVPDQRHELGETDDVTVRGHAGLADEYVPSGVLLLWQEDPGLSIGMGSRTLDLDQLLAIAEGLVVDADARTVDLGPLPDGLAGTLAPVGSVDDFATSPAYAPVGLTVPASGGGYMAVYRPVDPEDLFTGASVAAFAGGADVLAVVRWMTFTDTATDVRGHPGWAGSYQLPPWDDGEGIVPGTENLFISTLVWEEAPGVLALVQTFGADADARAMAESLRPVTDDEWTRLVHLGQSADVFMSEEARAAAGQLPVQDRRDSAAIRIPGHAINGAEGVYGVAGVWSTWLEPDGTLCGAVDAVDDDADPVERCDPEGGRVTTVHDSTGQPVLLIGVMPDGAVGRIAVDGDIEEAQTVSTPEEAPPYYVLVIADGAVPSAITFVDADGTDLDTVPVDP
jgi:hypothetical protein